MGGEEAAEAVLRALTVWLPGWRGRECRGTRPGGNVCVGAGGGGGPRGNVWAVGGRGDRGHQRQPRVQGGRTDGLEEQTSGLIVSMA